MCVHYNNWDSYQVDHLHKPYKDYYILKQADILLDPFVQVELMMSLWMYQMIMD